MIAEMHEIRTIATELQMDSSTADPRQRKIARIIEIIDRAVE